jgi:adenylate kinase
MKNMIFIGGIHGVGKTYFCNEINKRHNIPSYTASKLISAIKRKNFSNNKLITGIDRNQDYLTQAIHNLPITDPWFLLDGHFCLLNTKGDVTKVPRSTFNNLGIKAIILLTDSIESIAERLALRDSIMHNLSLLEDFQQQEIEYAKSIANENHIPIKIIHSKNDASIATDFLDSLIGSS